MALLFSILSLSLISWWLIRTELPSVFAPALSTSLLRRNVLVYGGFFLFLITLLLGSSNRFANQLELTPGNITVTALLILSVSAFLATYLTSFITKFSSICYAFLGAFAGLRIYIERDVEWISYLQFLLSWLVASLLTMIIAAAIYKLISFFISRSSSHLVKLTYYMRLLLVIGMIGLLTGFGINNGALLILINKIGLNDAGTAWGLFLPVVVMLSLFFLNIKRVNIGINRLSNREFDLNMPLTTSLVMASAIVLFLFSIKSIPESVVLKASPLSVSILLLSGLAGIGIVSKKEFIEREVITKAMISQIATPLAAIVISYMLFMLLNVDILSNGVISTPIHTPNSKGLMSILFIITVLVVVTLLIINYQKNRAIEKRVSASRQQQLYENQKSLNELEVKSVLAENRSLYNRLELKRKEMINVALNISEQKEFMEVIYNRLKELHNIESPEEKEKSIVQIEQLLSNKMSFSTEIDSFYSQVELLHKDFGIRLTEKFPKLTEQERRLTTLLRLGFSSKHIATLMNIAPKSVEISRYRLRTKFGLDRGDNLIQFIKSI